jgi:SAM-dependent methyltransferase
MVVNVPAVYDPGFYAGQMDRSRQSAEIIVPLIVEATNPRSMVDVGCGVGFWPRTFFEQGVEVAHGVDGPWVEPGNLQLPQDSFFTFDFERAEPPFRLPLPRDRYDLVTTFEFVEHVDERYAEPLVDLFCSLADVVIVGGAIPHQGGLRHVNERWPDYWAEKFERRGYEVCDFIRPQVWAADVEPWYAQNTIAYFKGGAPDSVKAIAGTAWSKVSGQALPLVHPELWLSKSLNSVARPQPLTQRLSPLRLARGLKRRMSGLFKG